MSAAVSSPAPPPPPAGVSPVEYVMGLTLDEKKAVLLALIAYALADNPEPTAIPVEKEGEPPMAYLLSAKEYDALQKQYQFPHANEGDYEAKRIPRGERDWATLEEMFDEDDAEAERETSPPATAAGSAVDR